LASALLKRHQLNLKQQPTKKNMKKTLITITGAAAILLALAQTSQAVPITGFIGFSGTVQLDTGDVSTATKAVNWFNTVVGTESGTFNAPLNSAVTIASPWSFNSGAIANFWQAGSAPQFTFNLSSSTASLLNLGGTEFLNVILFGTVSAAGFDTTAFTGSFQVANPPANGVTTFTERLSFNSVPDGGTTVMLLGAALSGMALIKRKFMA
jgi:hypothetical protein